MSMEEGMEMQIHLMSFHKIANAIHEARAFMILLLHEGPIS